MAEDFDNETETKVVAETIQKSAADDKVTVSTTTQSRAKVQRRIKTGMLDTPEIAALSISGAALLAVILAYFFLLLPTRAEFVRSETDRSEKIKRLLSLQEQAAQTRTSAAGTTDLVTSVNRFETNYLPVAATGNAALYKRLNDLIRANNLRNTAGPEYAALEAVEASRNKLTKGQSLFPGTGVTVTVEGSYQNLRRFISELENTKQFLVINAVEIESSGEQNDGNQPATDRAPVRTLPNPGIPSGIPGAPRTVNPQQFPGGVNDSAAPRAAVKPRGTVSLRLQMAAYFRRPASE